MAKIAYFSMRVGDKVAIGLRYSAPDLESGETIDVAVCVADPVGYLVFTDPIRNEDEVTLMIVGHAAGECVVTFTTTISSGHIYKDKYTVKVRS